MYYLIWQFSVLPLKKKKRSVMYNWSRNFGFTYNPVQISKGEHMVYSCVYFIYANELKQPRGSCCTTDWLVLVILCSQGLYLVSSCSFVFFFCFSCLLSLFARSLAILKVMAGNTVKKSWRKYRYTAPSPSQSRATKKNVYLHTPVESRDRGLWS